MHKKTLFRILILSFLLCYFINIMEYSAVKATENSNDNSSCPINSYILVTMNPEYSFPKRDYSPSYFGEEYVEKVETVFSYEEGDLLDKDSFCRVECLFLTEYGKKNIDYFMNELIHREDILGVEKDYSYQGITEFNGLSDSNSVPSDAIPIDDYILVTMKHDYSFKKEAFDPSYFGKEYVKEVEHIFTYEEGDFIDLD